MSWGESPSDFTGEPRKVFVNFLIWNIKQIEACIYQFRKGVLAAHMLMGLIDSLDEESKTKLKAQYEELRAFRMGSRTMLVGDAERIYRIVLSHLHAVYLEELRRRRLDAGDLERLESEKKP